MTFLKITLLIGCYCLALSARANISGHTLTSTYFPLGTSSGCANTDKPVGCVSEVSHSYSTLSSGTIKESLKEDIKAVEVDALDFIAGAPMTLALEEQIHHVREATNNELDNTTDEEVVVLLLEIAKT